MPHFFAFSPISTSRRVASERVGRSAWCSAHFTIAARSTGDARKPIMGSRPVAGLPRLFGLAFIDISEYWFSLKASRGEADTSAPALTQATEVKSMAQADR